MYILCFVLFNFSLVKESHVVALEMMPTMAIKMATSTGLCVLMTCTADLVTPEKKKILIFSSVVWSRAWFIWAPFIFILKMYDTVLPLTVFATLVVIGGILMTIINHSHSKSYKKVDSNQNYSHEKISTIVLNDLNSESIEKFEKIQV